MNPEFKRNLWLEVSPTRLLLMAGVLGLIFTITWFASDSDYRSTALAGGAQGLFGIIVGVWGSFKAGRSVSDEIRERTWDFQRLSAISPMAMTLGKLFGATIYVWFGGLICLAVYCWSAVQKQSLGFVTEDAARLLLAGVFAHAVALFVSLAVVRRGRGRDRVDAFVYTVAGIFAFNAGNTVSGRTFDWLRAIENPTAQPASALDWWGLPVGEGLWAFISLGALTLWAVATAWRLMRVELQAPANPLWFPLFLLTPAVIFAGTLTDAFMRVAAAYAIIHLLVLVVLLVEPKDIVSWRALAARRGTKGAGRYWPSIMSGLIVAFLAACAVAVAYAAAGSKEPGASPLLGFAAFAFLLRETAIFAFFHLGARQRRGDFAALLTIGLLCIAGPTVLGILSLGMANGLFFVQPDGGMTSHLLSIASGLVQAAVFGVMAQARWGGREKALAAA
jgi:hypothetical protein